MPSKSPYNYSYKSQLKLSSQLVLFFVCYSVWSVIFGTQQYKFLKINRIGYSEISGLPARVNMCI